MIIKNIAIFCLLISSNVWSTVYDLNPGRNSQKNIEVKSIKNSIFVKFNLKKLSVFEKSVNLSVGNFDKLVIDNLPNSYVIGAPRLPFYSFVVVGEPSELKLDYQLGKAIKISKDIFPVPSVQMPLRNKKKSKIKYVLNTKNYKKSEVEIKYDYIGDYKNQKLTRVLIRPISYKNFKNLVIYPNLSLKITNMKANSIIPNTMTVNKSLLIVTPDKFAKSLDEFVKFKKKNGFTVYLKTLSDFGDTAIKIKRSIKSFHKINNFDFAILVGDEFVFPTFYKETSSELKTPSDLSYFTFGVNDNIPDVYYSRFVINNKEQLLKQTKKIIAYSKNESNGEILNIASNEGDSPSDEDYVNLMSKPLIEKYSLQDNLILQRDPNVDNNTVVDIVSKGVNWINYIGHGSGTAWNSVDPDFSVNDILKISSSGQFPIVIDVACQNGRFVPGHFGERLMNQQSHGKSVGASAYYGGSVNISWNPPAIMAIGVSNSVGQGETIIGKALLDGQMYLLNNYDVIDEVYENFVWYHLFGDSSMKINL